MKINQIINEEDHYDTLDKTGFWGKRGVGAILFAKDSGRFLLVHRSEYVQEPNTWGVVGGAIDSGEDELIALKREIEEELGIHVETNSAKLLHEFKDERSGFVFHTYAILVPKEFEPTLDWENQGYGWFSLKTLPSQLHFGMIEILKGNKIK